MSVIVVDTRTSEGKELLALLNNAKKKPVKRTIINPFPISLLEIGLHRLLDGIESDLRKLVLVLKCRNRKMRRTR